MLFFISKEGLENLFSSIFVFEVICAFCLVLSFCEGVESPSIFKLLLSFKDDITGSKLLEYILPSDWQRCLLFFACISCWLTSVILSLFSKWYWRENLFSVLTSFVGVKWCLLRFLLCDNRGSWSRLPFNIDAFRRYNVSSASLAALSALAASVSSDRTCSIFCSFSVSSARNCSSPILLFAARRASTSSLYNYIIIDMSSRTSLTWALVFTNLARTANWRVDLVFSKYKSDGVAQQIIAIRAFPESAGWRIRVNFESLKFIWVIFEDSLYSFILLCVKISVGPFNIEPIAYIVNPKVSNFYHCARRFS